MESSDYHHALALLDWQIELGATEAICDAPVDRYTLPEKTQAPALTQKPAVAAAALQPARGMAAGPVAGSNVGPVAGPVPAAPGVDAVAEARTLAAAAQDLDGLRVALDAFEHCTLKRGARNLVFSDGQAGASVMIVGEAPGREEDREGRPFVGRAGQLLDRMLAAIDMGRDHATHPVYITNVVPWRPPQNRDPNPDEIAMLRPFVERHIALAAPNVLVVMGNISAQALLGKKGITRLRGNWTETLGLPVLPMFHPAYLLRNPAAKRAAWADLLSLKAHLGDG